MFLYFIFFLLGVFVALWTSIHHPVADSACKIAVMYVTNKCHNGFLTVSGWFGYKPHPSTLKNKPKIGGFDPQQLKHIMGMAQQFMMPNSRFAGANYGNMGSMDGMNSMEHIDNIGRIENSTENINNDTTPRSTVQRRSLKKPSSNLLQGEEDILKLSEQ